MTKINLRWLQNMKWSGKNIFFVCVFYLFWFFVCFICFVLFFFTLTIFLEIYFGFFNRCLTDCLQPASKLVNYGKRTFRVRLSPDFQRLTQMPRAGLGLQRGNVTGNIREHGSSSQKPHCQKLRVICFSHWSQPVPGVQVSGSDSITQFSLPMI